MNLAKIPFQIGLGLLTWEVFLASATLMPLVVVSAFLGRWVAVRIPQALFERIVLILTAAGAVHLLL